MGQIGAEEFLKFFQKFWKMFLAIFGPVPASPGAGAKTGGSQGPWLSPGQAPAPGEAEKGPKMAKNNFKKIVEKTQEPTSVGANYPKWRVVGLDLQVVHCNCLGPPK